MHLGPRHVWNERTANRVYDDVEEAHRDSKDDFHATQCHEAPIASSADEKACVKHFFQSPLLQKSPAEGKDW